MSGPGWGAALACGVLLLFLNSVVLIVVSQASEGKRNSLAGLRVPAMMKSDEAWRAGHRAAKRVIVPFVTLAMVFAVVSVFIERYAVCYIVLLALSLGCTLLSVIIGAVVGSRQAKLV